MQENEISIWRPRWFLMTRYLAVVGVLSAIIAAKYFFNLRGPDYRMLLILGIALLLTNTGYWFYYHFGCLAAHCEPSSLRRRLTVFTIVQINFDLVLLTLLLHFCGGATNPFVFYYIFHVILASILLSQRAAYIEAGIASLLFSTMTILEGIGAIDHYRLIISGSYTRPSFMIGACIALISTLVIAAYMASSIMEQFRRHQRELERSLAETERLELEKSRFLDVVAHDLKGPVASIETMATSALAAYGDQMTPEIRKVFERIPVRTSNLLSFIHELLEFSKLTSIDKITTQVTALNFLPIVTATAEMYMNQALDKHIRIAIQSDPVIPMVSGNREHLERMVGNLVSNAVQYTPDGGSVTIRIASEADSVILTVADTGIGIPEEAQKHIFTDFFRATNARKLLATGTGLGLSITRAIVLQHGGSITFTSTEGEGTIFTVRLPVRKA